MSRGRARRAGVVLVRVRSRPQRTAAAFDVLVETEHVMARGDEKILTTDERRFAGGNGPRFPRRPPTSPLLHSTTHQTHSTHQVSDVTREPSGRRAWAFGRENGAAANRFGPVRHRPPRRCYSGSGPPTQTAAARLGLLAALAGVGALLVDIYL